MKKTALLFLLMSFFGTYAQQRIIETTSKVQNISAVKFNQLLEETPNAQLLDIRTPVEFNAGHIKNAILVNYYDRNFANNILKLGLDKNQPVFIYCRSGHRSGNAVIIFKKLGFKKIINLAHGINDWYRQGLPLEK